MISTLSIRRGAAALLLLAAGQAAAQQPVGYAIIPSRADPAVKQFDDPSIAITSRTVAPDAPLAIFMPGTGGRPANAGVLLQAIANQGYRVLGLEYDDTPAVVQVCPRDPDPACSANFRDMRLTGTGPSRQVHNTPAESIVGRLVAALRLLDREHPGEGWGQYIDGDQPRWERILVSGLSQGAGMAAYIAQQHAVYRVVLFSSPWDFTAGRKLAPWLSRPSATPPERWQAAYNARENTADLLAQAYPRLGIPAANVHVFRLDLPAGMRADGPNPYHAIGMRDPRYLPEWKEMFGSPR